MTIYSIQPSSHLVLVGGTPPHNVGSLKRISFGLCRACPGAHLAKSMLQIAAASILCLFDIVPALDAEGNDIEVIPEFTPASLTS
jgi:hypothetical protein